MASREPARKAAGALNVANDDASRAAPLPRHEPVPDEPVDVNAMRAESIDRLVHAWQARFTASISPAALRLAFSDWATQFLNSPGKQQLLIEKAARKWLRLIRRKPRPTSRNASPRSWRAQASPPAAMWSG